MDPISSIDAVASIFKRAEKVMKTSSRLRQSADGILSENHEIEITLVDLKGLVDRLASMSDPMMEDSVSLRSICDVSTEVGKEIREMLGKMRVVDTTSSWEVARKSFHSVLKEPDKQRLLNRLSHLQSQLTLHMQVDILLKVCSIERKLDTVINTTRGAEISAKSEVVAVSDDVLEVASNRVANSEQEMTVGASETDVGIVDELRLVKKTPSAPILRSPTQPKSAITIQTPFRFQCDNDTCPCVCHLGYHFKTPQFFSRFLGAVRFRGTCKNHSSNLWELKYWTPSFLSHYNLYLIFERTACGTPSFGLKFQRKVAWGGEDTIIRFAFTGDTDGIKSILDSGMGCLDDVEPNHGLTPLHYAVINGHIPACKVLLDAGASPFIEDANNTSAEEKAWENILTNRGSARDLAELRVLFPDYDLSLWGFSSLHMAVLGTGDVLRSTLSADTPSVIDINARDVRGRAPLHWAALRSDLKAVELLLEAGADVRAVDESNATPLSYAVSSAIPRMIELLILRGADVNATNNHGDTTLHYAAHKGGLATVRILVNAGAAVDARNWLGNTPFARAAIYNSVAVGRYLLKQGADRYSVNMYGDTPLRETVQHNCHDFLQMLLDDGTRYDEVNKRGSTVLHNLALEGDTRTVQLLISAGIAGVDPETRNTDKKTAMDLLEGRSGSPPGFKEAFLELLAAL